MKTRGTELRGGERLLGGFGKRRGRQKGSLGTGGQSFTWCAEMTEGGRKAEELLQV